MKRILLQYVFPIITILLTIFFGLKEVVSAQTWKFQTGCSIQGFAGNQNIGSACGPLGATDTCSLPFGAMQYTYCTSCTCAW